jgi:hypothetical protein
MERIRRVIYHPIVGLLLAVLVAGCAAQSIVTLTEDKTPKVVEFSAQPAVVERNGQVTLRWHVRNVKTVTIQQRHGS